MRKILDICRYFNGKEKRAHRPIVTGRCALLFIGPAGLNQNIYMEKIAFFI